MKFEYSVKPKIVEARTKQELLNKLNHGGSNVYSHLGNCIQFNRRHNDVYLVRVFNLERHRPVKVQELLKNEKSVFQGEKGTVRKTKIVKSGFWRAYVYDVSTDALHLLNLRAIQNGDTFYFESQNSFKKIKPNKSKKAA